MDIETLKFFVCVCQMKNFSRAAEKLNISQPALSKRISNLERELNTLLINRDSRNMEITQSGRLVYQTANEILQKVDAMVQSIDNINSGVKGTVKVCFPRSVHLGTLRDAIIIMSNEYPDIVVTCTCENSSHEVIEKLAKNEVDIAYMNQGDIPVSKDFIVEAQTPVFPRQNGSRCRSSREVNGSPTPFSALIHYLS